MGGRIRAAFTDKATECPPRIGPVDPLRNDLEGARELGVAVEMHLTTGDKLLTGLHHWPEDSAGWFSVYAPQTSGDDSVRKVHRDQVSHWVVTKVVYQYPG